MGIGNMFSTLMETAYKLLMDTVFYIMAIAVLAGSFGMGLILTTFMTGLGFMTEAIIGNLGAIIGSIISVRIMNYRIRK